MAGLYSIKFQVSLGTIISPRRTYYVVFSVADSRISDAPYYSATHYVKKAMVPDSKSFEGEKKYGAFRYPLIT